MYSNSGSNTILDRIQRHQGSWSNKDVSLFLSDIFENQQGVSVYLNQELNLSKIKIKQGFGGNTLPDSWNLVVIRMPLLGRTSCENLDQPLIYALHEFNKLHPKSYPCRFFIYVNDNGHHIPFICELDQSNNFTLETFNSMEPWKGQLWAAMENIASKIHTDRNLNIKNITIKSTTIPQSTDDNCGEYVSLTAYFFNEAINKGLSFDQTSEYIKNNIKQQMQPNLENMDTQQEIFYRDNTPNLNNSQANFSSNSNIPSRNNNDNSEKNIKSSERPQQTSRPQTNNNINQNHVNIQDHPLQNIVFNLAVKIQEKTRKEYEAALTKLEQKNLDSSTLTSLKKGGKLQDLLPLMLKLCAKPTLEPPIKDRLVTLIILLLNKGVDLHDAEALLSTNKITLGAFKESPEYKGFKERNLAYKLQTLLEENNLTDHYIYEVRIDENTRETQCGFRASRQNPPEPNHKIMFKGLIQKLERREQEDFYIIKDTEKNNEVLKGLIPNSRQDKILGFFSSSSNNTPSNNNNNNQNRKSNSETLSSFNKNHSNPQSDTRKPKAKPKAQDDRDPAERQDPSYFARTASNPLPQNTSTSEVKNNNNLPPTSSVNNPRPQDILSNSERREENNNNLNNSMPRNNGHTWNRAPQSSSTFNFNFSQLNVNNQSKQGKQKNELIKLLFDNMFKNTLEPPFFADIKNLLNQGISPSKQDETDWNALNYALNFKNKAARLEIIKLLLAEDPDKQSLLSTKSGDEDCVLLLSLYYKIQENKGYNLCDEDKKLIELLSQDIDLAQACQNKYSEDNFNILGFIINKMYGFLIRTLDGENSHYHALNKETKTTLDNYLEMNVQILAIVAKDAEHLQEGINNFNHLYQPQEDWQKEYKLFLTNKITELAQFDSDPTHSFRR